MESKDECFYVKTDDLYSSKNKLEKAVEGINSGNLTRSHGEPILVSKMSEGKYYIVDGNHRALELASSGKPQIKARLSKYKESLTEMELDENTVCLTNYIKNIKSVTDQSRVPSSVPRYLYHATYKQMLPTIKRNGGLQVGAFLAKSYNEALNDAEMVENLDDDWKNNIIVFKINTGKLNHDKIEVDDNENPGAYYYNDVVPSKCLVKNG
jgi:hypothetical protein